MTVATRTSYFMKQKQFNIFNLKRSLRGEFCGCYNCLEMFEPAEVKYVKYGAALCPYCDKPSVLSIDNIDSFSYLCLVFLYDDFKPFSKYGI